MGISVGTAALVARFYGAQERAQADLATRQSMLLALTGALLTSLPLMAVGGPLLEFMGAEPLVLPDALVYLNLILLATPLLFITMVIAAALRGAGDAKTPLVIMVLNIAINVLLDWLLIFGAGPIPPMGVEGTAWATVISRAVALGVGLWLLRRTTLAGALRGSFRPAWAWFARVLRIGWPAGLQGFLRSASSLAYFTLIGRTADGTAGIAALTVGIQSESLAFVPGMAFGMTATALVGQNLGAGRPDRARRSGWLSALQGLLVMSVLGLLFFLLAEPFARLFTREPDVVELAALYLMVNAPSEPFLGLAMILTGALNGAGETRIPAVLTFVTLWLCRIPLTWYLGISRDMGALGGWISMSATTILGGLLTAAAFHWGKWGSRRV
jgi:putative MATE family efflux protein